MNQRIKKLFLSAVILPCVLSFFLFGTALAGVYVLQPRYDETTNTWYNSTVTVDAPDSNFNAILGIVGGSEIYNLYLQFDLSPITDFHKVSSIVLCGHLWAISNDKFQPLGVYYVPDNTWNPRTVTWNTRPDLGIFLGRSAYFDVSYHIAAWNLLFKKDDLNKIHKGDNLLSLAVVNLDKNGTGVQFWRLYLIVTTDTPDSP